jgi:hypothetical protein
MTVSNQTNLAIKGIIAIQAMTKMSAVVGEGADVNKYTVSATRLCFMSNINSFVAYCYAPLCAMEEPCIEQRPAAYTCSVWAK